jgi:DnaJ-class molecular chaperone
MDGESCSTCGGDGRVGNVFGGSTATCPSCRGTGRRAEQASRFHDVTKTKPEHYRPVVTQSSAGPTGPVTGEGAQLALEVNASTVLSADAKVRLVAEIVQHETSHGRCTKTFLKKVRKQTRPAPP